MVSLHLRHLATWWPHEARITMLKDVTSGTHRLLLYALFLLRRLKWRRMIEGWWLLRRVICYWASLIVNECLHVQTNLGEIWGRIRAVDSKWVSNERTLSLVVHKQTTVIFIKHLVTEHLLLLWCDWHCKTWMLYKLLHHIVRSQLSHTGFLVTSRFGLPICFLYLYIMAADSLRSLLGKVWCLRHGFVKNYTSTLSRSRWRSKKCTCSRHCHLLCILLSLGRGRCCSMRALHIKEHVKGTWLSEVCLLCCGYFWVSWSYFLSLISSLKQSHLVLGS